MKTIDNVKLIYPWPTEMYEFIMHVWQTQGKTNKYNCTGMSSFTFWPEGIVYDATNDALYRMVN
jgi:hypothetical protein